MNDKYGHADEWREEELMRQAQAKQKPWIDPRDPNYVAPDRKCTGCGSDIEDLPEEYTTCHSCFFSEIDTKRITPIRP